jgi:bifunctional non-homologous end joining protein LigD
VSSASAGDQARTQRTGSPELADLPPGLEGHDAVLDGEVVICENGRPAFHLLRRRFNRWPGVGPKATYRVFDLLHLDGEDVYHLPWLQRRTRLEGLGIDTPCWQVPRHFPSDELSDVQEATKKLGLEGVVVKRTDAAYEPGRRSSAWVKHKHVKHDALVVGAIRPPTRSRPLTGSSWVGLETTDCSTTPASSRLASLPASGRSSCAPWSGAGPTSARSAVRH